jgi:SAM-dependent methyltransferase
MGTDAHWEQWGANDPYFGVLSDERYRAGSITEGARADFFASGEGHVERIIHDARQLVGDDFSPRSALDFGCGVGRLVIPLAQRMSKVVGVDVSPSMLALAERNCAECGLDNVVFALSDDVLSRVPGSFDLVHSTLVLQHISWRRGRMILQVLAEHVASGGCLAVQFLVGHESPPFVRALVRLRYAFPPANWLRNILRRRPLLEPPMQLHIYDADTVKRDLQGFVCTTSEVPTPGYRSIILYAHRQAGAVVLSRRSKSQLA